MAHHPHNMAQGLASLGRGGDSTLVHMSPAEVGGLQKLAMAHGGTLTRNPHTGLPEAGFLSSILPMIGGALTAVFAPEMLPEEAAATGLIEKATGKTWGQSIMAGLSAYGAGAGVGSLANMGAGAVESAGAGAGAEAMPIAGTAPVAAEQAATDIPALADTSPTFYGDSMATDAATNISNITPDLSQTTAPLLNSSGQVAGETGMGGNFLSNAPNQGELAKAGISNFSPKQFYQGLGSSNTTRMAALGGMGAGLSKALASSQGAIPGVTNQNEYYVQAPGGKPLFNPGTINPNIAKLGYLPAGQEAMIGQGFNPGVWTTTSPIAAQTATAGAPVMTGTGVTGAKEGGLMGLKKRHFDAGGSTVSPATGNQMLAAAQANYPGPAAAQQTPQSEILSGMNQLYAGQLAQSALQQPSNMLPPPPPPDAMNQYLANVNQMITPSTVTGGGITPEPSASPVNATPADYAANTPSLSSLWDSAAYSNNPYANTANVNVNGVGGSSYIDNYLQGRSVNMAHGGLADLTPTYAAGGKLLRGDGDGMSDSIPAVIHGEKPQRAALADGEFVIPADVVSHLGNGSTEAGSRKLYAMMDKVRYARTGNKNQGKQINPDKFMPS
jgi:hypothetical protein